MLPDHHDQVFRHMDEVKIGFERDMECRLQDGFPDVDPAVRVAILGGTSLLAVAYSAGSSNAELGRGPLAEMAALTAITGVANRLIDKDDQAMRSATLRWCGIHPTPESTMPTIEASRLRFMQGIDEITQTIVSPDDYGVVLSVVRRLMAANIAAHDLTIGWRQARGDQEVVFWDSHTDDVVRNLLVTGAMQSATIPLNGMYHQQDPATPSSREVLSDPFIQAQDDAANSLIRIDDDSGDRLRDSDPRTESINLFNIAPSAHGERVLGQFCVQAGIKDALKIDKLVTHFRAVGTDTGAEKAMRAIRSEFEQNFWEANDRVSGRFGLYKTLVVRALAAGRANTIGDDAINEQREVL